MAPFHAHDQPTTTAWGTSSDGCVPQKTRSTVNSLSHFTFHLSKPRSSPLLYAGRLDRMVLLLLFLRLTVFLGMIISTHEQLKSTKTSKSLSSQDMAGARHFLDDNIRTSPCGSSFKSTSQMKLEVIAEQPIRAARKEDIRLHP